MATKTKSTVKKTPNSSKESITTGDLILVNIKEINRGDTIYIDKSATTPWLVIDVGSPFVLIENLHTHFASLYHGTEFYKTK